MPSPSLRLLVLYAPLRAPVISSVFLFTSPPSCSVLPLPALLPARSSFSGHVVIYSFNSVARGLPRIKYHAYLMARISLFFFFFKRIEGALKGWREGRGEDRLFNAALESLYTLLRIS